MFRWPTDIFIASHCIEHLSLTDFCLLARWLRGVPVVHFQAPLPDVGPKSWDRYGGSHILPVGWDAVTRVMWENRLELVTEGLYSRTYKSLDLVRE